MNCRHIVKGQNIQSARVKMKSTGDVHIFCMECFKIFEGDPRNNPVQSVGYYVYVSPQSNLPREQWVRVNDKPIPPTESGKIEYRSNYLLPDGSEIYMITVNAIGIESAPAKAKIIDAPRVVVKSVILFGDTTNEGKLIEAVTIPWFEIIEILRKDPNAAFEIPANTWEEIIAGAYKKAGFDDVILTPRSGDYGRDVIAVKKGLGTIRIIDQVKAYKPGHLVDANDVRALVGVLHGDGASKAFLTTTSDFAPRLPIDPLITPFMPSRLELINGQKLLKRLIELGK